MPAEKCYPATPRQGSLDYINSSMVGIFVSRGFVTRSVHGLIAQNKKVATMMDRRKETSVVKKALKNAGIKARVTHGTGTAWGWIEVNIGNPEERGGLEPYPNGCGSRYTDEESDLHSKTLRIVQEVTGRHGEYNGNISILSQDVV